MGRHDQFDKDLTLTEWLVSTSEAREKLLDYSRSAIPTDPGARQLDVSDALSNGQDAGDLLADAELYLAQSFASEVLAAREKHDAKTAAVVAQGKTARLERVRAGLSVMYQTIKDRRFVLMNLNRS